MYNEYFGLTDRPFSIAPDPRYLYMSDQHREALAHLMYGIQQDGGFILLTGFVFGSILLGISLEGDEFAHQILVYIHYSGVIIEVSAVVLGTENGDQLLVFPKEPIPVFHHLVAPADQIKVVLSQEFLKLFFSENKATPSFVLLPVLHVVIGVVPEQICHEALVRDVSRLRDRLNLFKAVHVLGNATMHAHYLLVDESH